MDVVVIALFWVLCLLAMLWGRKALLYLLFASFPFGVLAALPPTLTGGLSLTPTPIVGGLIVLYELGNRRGLALTANWALRPSRLLLLFAFWLCALITTLFMPRLFAGQISVVPTRTEFFMELAWLQPTAQNFSQLVYLSASVLAVVAFARMMRAPGMREASIKAMCLGSAVMVLTGLLDMASAYVPMDAVLEPFRTASYQLLTTAEVEGGKRVVGLMSEASAFGSQSLGFLALLYFFRRALPRGMLRDGVVPVLMLLLALMVWVSTSSASYVGLAVLGLVAVAEWVWRLLAVRRNALLRRGLTTEFWLGMAVLCAVMGVMLVLPRTLEPIYAMVNEMVFQKSSTASFDERNMWTRTAWDALWASYGLGVGLGGTRASNYAVVLASNTGVLGVLLYFLFVLQTLRRQAPSWDPQGRALLSAVRWSYLPPLAISLLIGGTPDFGLQNAFLYGLALAVAYGGARARQARPVRPVRVGAPARKLPRRGPAAPLAAREAHVG